MIIDSSKNRSIFQSITPHWLFSIQNLNDLVRLTLELEGLRRSLKVYGFGPQVMDLSEARRLFTETVKATQDVIPWLPPGGETPEIRLTDNLSRLPIQCLKLFFIFLFINLGLCFLVELSDAGGLARWIPVLVVVFLQSTPFLICRRTRLSLEHQCGYVRGDSGRCVIVIDQLPRFQFQSFLAHEYAHHLHRLHMPEVHAPWVREGWARLVQWHIAYRLKDIHDNQAYLYHVVVQMMGELKFAVEMISLNLGQTPPRFLRRLKTMYHRNPLYNLVTGTPGFNPTRLAEHALGTAAFLLLEKQKGLKAALTEPGSNPAGH